MRTVTAACVAWLASLLPGDVTAQAPSPGAIVYVDTAEEGRTHLAVVRPDGSGGRRLAGPYPNAVSPSVEGGVVAFTNWISGGKAEVLFRRADGTVEKVFGGGVLESLAKDARWFLATPLRSRAADLLRVDVGAKAGTPLTKKLAVAGARLSPKGDAAVLAATEGKGTNADLHLLDLASGSLTRLTQTTKEDESSPAFSPDGATVAFVHSGPGKAGVRPVEIRLLDLATRAVRGTGLSGGAPSFSPDGTELVFELDEDLAVRALSSTGPVRLLVKGGRMPCWTSAAP